MLVVDQVKESIQVIANSSQDLRPDRHREPRRRQYRRMVAHHRCRAAAGLEPADHRHPGLCRRSEARPTSTATPMFAGLDAVKNKRVYKFPQFNRSPDAAEIYLSDEWLARVAHPDLFPDKKAFKTSITDAYKLIYQKDITEDQLQVDPGAGAEQGFDRLQRHPRLIRPRAPAAIAGARASPRSTRDGAAGSSSLRSSLVLVFCVIYSITLGRYGVGMSNVWLILWDHVVPVANPSWTRHRCRMWCVAIRLPRILAALLIGAGLAISGAALQGLFRNPLVDPSIIGVTAGAGFGGTLAILMVGGGTIVLGAAFVFGIASLLIVRFLATVKGRTSTLTFVLAGVVVSAFFEAAISILKLLADPHQKLPAITYWLMGSIAVDQIQAISR